MVRIEGGIYVWAAAASMTDGPTPNLMVRNWIFSEASVDSRKVCCTFCDGRAGGREMSVHGESPRRERTGRKKHALMNQRGLRTA